MNVKELRVWFQDESFMTIEGDWAKHPAAELFRYSREGMPRFIELHENDFHAASWITSFEITEEEQE